MKKLLLAILLCSLILTGCRDSIKEEKSNDIPENYSVVSYHIDGTPIIEDDEGEYYYLDEAQNKAYRIYFERILDGKEKNIKEGLIGIDGMGRYSASRPEGMFSYYYDADNDIRVPLNNFPEFSDAEIIHRDFEFNAPYTSLSRQELNRGSVPYFSRYLHIPADTDTIKFFHQEHYEDIIVSKDNEHFRYVGGFLVEEDTRTVLLCNSLGHHFVIPEGTKALGPFIFHELAGDDGTVEGTSVTLPDSLESIDRYTFLFWQPDVINFEGNDYLPVEDNLVMNKDKTIAIIATDRNTKMPDTIEEIYPNAFRDRYVDTISRNVKIIGAMAFAKGTVENRSAIRIPNIEYIDLGAFYDAGIRGTLYFGNKLKYVGDQAFYGSGVKINSLYGSLEYIGKQAFYRATINNVVIPSTLKTISEEAFSGSNIGKLTFEEGLESIYSKAFSSATLPSSVTLPSSLTGIFSEAFKSVKGLEKLEILSSDHSIWVYGEAFYGCHDLKEVILPDNLYINGWNVFDYSFDARIKLNEDAKSYEYVETYYPSQLEVSIW